jgi:hypothetical protein
MYELVEYLDPEELQTYNPVTGATLLDNVIIHKH